MLDRVGGRVGGLLVVWLSIWGSSLEAAPRALEIDGATTRIDVRFGATLQTVRGTLGPVAGTLFFDDQTGNPARGEVVIDLSQSATGIGRRDRKMHAKILQTDRYPRAVFRLERLDLPQPLREGSNSLQLHGKLDFHGATHAVSMPAQVQVQSDRITANGSLIIPYIAWGLADPSYLLLRVAKEVRAEVQLGARLKQPLEEARATQR